MTMLSYLVDVTGLAFDEQTGGNSTWVHALPVGSFKHPIYGTIDVNSDRAKRFADGVNSKVRGIDLSINYVHNNNDVAAGWTKKAEARSDGVWLFVEWTDDAAKQIKEKKWRYFSSEFDDEWEDPQGTMHKDVMFGGALTNRPFMKNLVPINLSEAVYDNAFELVAAVQGVPVDSLKGGNTVPLSEEDLKKIVEGVSTKLAENKTTDPVVKRLTEIPELKELADANPLVKLLISQVEAQNIGIATSAKQLKEAEIERKLADFDRSKVILTPVARKLAFTLAEAIPDELSEAFWQLLTEMKKGTSFLVELGERAGATVNYGSHKSAHTLLSEAATKIRGEHKDLTETDAFEAAVSENPALYARYRHELLEGVK
jgi:hypothetical protein